MVGINAADHVVDRLRKDKRFLVIYTATNKVSVPDQGWITHLKTWLVVRGIPEFNANRFVEDVHSRTRLEIAKELDVFLRHTLRYRAAQD